MNKEKVTRDERGGENLKKKGESDGRISSDRFAHVPAEIPDLAREDRAYYSPKLAATLIRVRA